jgi:HK97 family phage major capsid protein
VVTSPLVDQLAARFDRLAAEHDAIANRANLEGRDLLPSELAHMQELGVMSDRLVQVREDEERRSAGVAMMAAAPTGSPAGMVHVRRDEAIYRPPDASGPYPSFFRDLLHAQTGGDVDARARIDRHRLQTRAVGTTVTGPGVVPPTWLFAEFAVLAHGARPWADTLRRIQIDNANPVSLGTQTAGATVAATTEGAAAPDGSFNATVLTTNPVTYTGKVDISRQLIDGGNPAVDGLVYADCMGAYNEAVETAVVNAFEALAPPVTITYPGTAPAYTNLPDCFVDAGASLIKRRKLAASHVLMSAGAWAFLSKQKDTNGRPLLTTGVYGPTNAYGLALPDYLGGETVGLACVPSWAQTVDNHLYVVRADDMLLLESNTFNFRYEEVLGPSAVRLGVWGYAAPILGRYASSTIRINAGTTIPAPALADEEPAAVETRSRR